MIKTSETKKLYSLTNLKRKISFGIILAALTVLTVSVAPHFAKADTNAATEAASDITDTAVTFNGSTDLSFPSETYWFQYVQSDEPVYLPNFVHLSSKTSVKSATAGQLSESITGLSPSKKYFYEVCLKFNPDPHYIGDNIVTCGDVLSFTTNAAGTPTNCVISSFTANPTSIDAGESSTLSWTTNNYNCSSAKISNVGNVSPLPSGVSVSPATTTTYTLTGYGSGGGTNDSQSVTVSVIPPPPPNNAITDVLTGGATNTDTTATLSGSANPGGTSALTSGYFRYSTVTPGNVSPVFCNDIYGSNMLATNEVPLGGGSSPVTFSSNISNLLPNTTYYYCAIVSNSSQINYTGSVKYFTTWPTTDNPGTTNPTSLITTRAALVVNSTSAYLNGFFNNPGIFSSQTWFEYKKALGGGTSPVVNTGGISINTNQPVAQTGRQAGPSTTLTSGANGDSPYGPWKKVDTESHAGKTTGTLNFLLTGLSPNTSYQFRAVINTNQPKLGTGIQINGKKVIIPSSSSAASAYGNILIFQTKSPGSVTPGNVPNGNCSDTNNPDCNNNPPAVPHTLGEVIAPPVDATVHYHEGIETVLARQIVGNSDIAEKYGYTEGKDLQSFAWYLADVLARDFGYVNSKGKEIRVSKPDVAAYELQLTNGDLTVYEYYNSKIVNIQKLSNTLRGKYFYEYYFKK